MLHYGEVSSLFCSAAKIFSQQEFLIFRIFYLFFYFFLNKRILFEKKQEPRTVQTATTVAFFLWDNGLDIFFFSDIFILRQIGKMGVHVTHLLHRVL